jgi:hypothetical protein
MKVMIAALAIFLLAVLGMALGVIFGKRCIRGSCGGLSGIRDESGRPMCDHCPSRNDATNGEPEKSEAASR